MSLLGKILPSGSVLIYQSYVYVSCTDSYLHREPIDISRQCDLWSSDVSFSSEILFGKTCVIMLGAGSQ